MLREYQRLDWRVTVKLPKPVISEVHGRISSTGGSVDTSDGRSAGTSPAVESFSVPAPGRLPIGRRLPTCPTSVLEDLPAFFKRPGCCIVIERRMLSRIRLQNNHGLDTHPSPAKPFSDHRLYHWRRFVCAFPHCEERRSEACQPACPAGNRSTRDPHL